MLPHTFMIPGSSRVFERTSCKRLPIQQLWGPSLPAEFDNYSCVVARGTGGDAFIRVAHRRATDVDRLQDRLSHHARPLQALMTIIAFAFLQFRRLKRARRGKKNQRTTASTKLAGRPSRHRGAHRPTATAAMPTLPKTDLREHAA